jgi:chloramphenicol 3-O-phosphotransferase
MDLVFLHGPAAAGKLTTARALHDRLGHPVFHNHLVVDLLTTVFPFGSEPFVRLREQFWLAVFSDAARADRSLLFTFAPESTVQPGFPERTRRVVEDAGGRVRFVRLLVSDAEQERRITSESRRRFAKLTDVETLRSLRAHRGGVEEPPVDLSVDTDASSPQQTAAAIIDHFGLSAEHQPGRYPELG